MISSVGVPVLELTPPRGMELTLGCVGWHAENEVVIDQRMNVAGHSESQCPTEAGPCGKSRDAGDNCCARQSRSVRKRRLIQQPPPHVLKHLVDVFLYGSLDEECICRPAQDAAHQLDRRIEAGIGLVAFGFQRPGQRAPHAPTNRLPNLESTMGCMPAWRLECSHSEFL